MNRRRRTITGIWAAPAAAVAALCGGCTPPYARDERAIWLVRRGEFAQAGARVAERAPADPANRSYMLDRVKLVQLALAEGLPSEAEPLADRLYDFLRTQGVNVRNRFNSFVLGEGNARLWKGEPYEQAMALALIAALDGMNGDWGNVRASANSALFQLRDFTGLPGDALGPPGPGQRQRLISALAEHDRSKGRAADDGSGVAIVELTTPVVSDFALGYALKAIATRQLGDAFPGELEQTLAQLVAVAPELEAYAQRIGSGRYNTVLVVEAGLGPEKYQSGPDGAIASFRARSRTGDEPLVVSAGQTAERFPAILDANELALSLRWNSLEDVRLAKSAIGTGLIAAGAATAALGRNNETRLVGLGLALLGVALKATSGADTRHNELLPQRAYVALLEHTDAAAPITLRVEGDAVLQLVLADVPVPPPGVTQLRYVRLPDEGPLAWATSGRVHYGNDASGAPPDASNYPVILGGLDARTPSEEVLSSYQRSGHLLGLSLNDLIDLYRAEGVLIAGRDAGPVGVHVLEGGRWLYTPLSGTTGFARLYGQPHPPYAPRSQAARAAAAGVNR
ncbi:MAG: hypothetical protein C0475_04445 [Planctomyces sp.]|nr:hypothetical protein [Planctomyces sp.]